MDPVSSLLSRTRGIRRAIVMALAAATAYAVLLGPVGALGQDPTPTPTATSTPAATAEPSQAQLSPEPEPTETASPESTPEQSSTPESAPEQEATPEQTSTPEQSSTPESTPSPDGDQASDEELFDLAGDDAHEDECDVPSTGEHGQGELSTSDRASERDSQATADGTRKNKKRTRKDDGHAHGDHPVLDDRKRKRKLRHSDGTPTLDNPTFTVATPGAAPIGVPNFMIEKFRIPPFLLPIYQAAGIEYGIRWEILAAINEIETDYGRNLNVSSAGALGWMQFMPATWKAYGTDANRDGVKDPYNPVDAIFSAARYLRAAGAETDLRKGIFAYNHADWYVDSVIMRARLIGGLPSNFVGSLTGLTQARFPVFAKATYAGDIDEKDAKRLSKRQKSDGPRNAAFAVQGDETRRDIKIFARRGAPVVAVNDGRIVRMGTSKRLGRFVQLQDVYGNVFTYGHLGTVARTYPAPRTRRVSDRQIARELDLPRKDAAPTAAASAGSNKRGRARRVAAAPAPPVKERVAAHEPAAGEAADPLAIDTSKERLYANPARPAARTAGGELQLAEADYRPSANSPLRLSRRDYQAKPLRKGARVIAGTILGRIGRTSPQLAPHVLFEIRPAGRGAPRIDPKPILDGWKLLESTEIYRAAGKNPFFGHDAATPSIGQILLMSKDALVRRVLANPRVDIYGCGRQDIRAGAIDRRVLATLEFLAASGLKPTVTSLKCGHGVYTASGNVSHHSSGNAVDIAAINGIVITPATQGKGSITELAVQRLLTLQGTMKPDQIITLMKFEGSDNTYAMGDHHDHIHVGWQPLYGTNSKAAKQVNAVLKPDQWIKLIERLKEIDNPEVRRGPAEHVLRVDRDARKRLPARRSGHASHAHAGE